MNNDNITQISAERERERVYLASCSFGKDSLAMVLRLIEENKPLDEVIYYDTGMEFKSIYNNRDKVSNVLYKNNIKFTTLKPEQNFYYQMLVKPVKKRNKAEGEYSYTYGYDWCGGLCRWGTSEKTRVLDKYCKTQYPDKEIFKYIGIAFDEQERMKNDQHKLYPLVEWKMLEKDCLQYCYDHGYDWDEDGTELYSLLDRVSCWCCRNKNLKELKNIYQYLPRYWQMLRGLQSRIDRPMKGEGKSVFELEERFKKELSES